MSPTVPDVLSRIAERDAARKQRASEAIADREDTAGRDAVEAEQQLNAMQLAIETRLRTSNDGAENQQEISAIAPDIGSLEQHIARNAWLLPPYALRKAEDGAAALRLQLQAAVAATKPRKRFGFSARSRGAGDAAAPSAQAPAQPAAQPAAPHAADAGGQHEPSPNSTVRGLSGQKVVKRADDLAGGDFTLADLEDCTVLLLGELSALRLLRARRCCIMAGPIAGAAYLGDVTDSQVVLAAHQVRIHTSSGSSVFLDVGSNPIIEHCSGMGFGPLTPQQRKLLSLDEAPGAKAAAAAASPSASGGHANTDSSGADAAALPQPDGAAAAASGSANCWRAVQDFNWLRSTPSPNWHVMTDDEISRAAGPLPD